MPDDLTFEDGIRVMGLKSREKAKCFVTKERKANDKFLKSKGNVSSKGQKTGKGKRRKKVMSTQKTPEATHSETEIPSSSNATSRAKRI